MKLRQLLVLVPTGIIALSAGCAPATCGNLQKDKYDVYQTYQQNCAGCHGDQLQGGVGPSLKHIGKTLTEEQIKQKIEQGSFGMPPFDKRLDEKQVLQLAQMLVQEK